MGAGRKHRKVEKGHTKAKISPYQHQKKKKGKKKKKKNKGKKKKSAAGPGQGNCSFEENRTAFTSSVISNNKRGKYIGRGEERRCTHAGSAPAPSAALSHSHTFLLFPEERYKHAPRFHPQSREKPAAPSGLRSPQAICQQGTRIAKPVNEQIEILIYFLEDFMAIAEDKTQERRVWAQLPKAKRISAQPA